MAQLEGRPHGLQIYRPVVGGETDFLDKARFVGAEILGETFPTSVHSEGVVFDDEADPEAMSWTAVERPVPRAVLDVVRHGDMCLPLLQRVAPKDYVSRYSFPYHLARLTATRRPWRQASKRAGARRESLYAELNEASERAGFEPESLLIECDHLELIGISALALGLNPADPETRFLQRQATLSHRRLARQSRRAAYPRDQASGLRIEFAELPPGISDVRYQRVVEGLQALLPVKLLLGAPTHPQPR